MSDLGVAKVYGVEAISEDVYWVGMGERDYKCFMYGGEFGMEAIFETW